LNSWSSCISIQSPRIIEHATRSTLYVFFKKTNLIKKF
jgi:hypothetical protein